MCVVSTVEQREISSMSFQRSRSVPTDHKGKLPLPTNFLLKKKGVTLLRSARQLERALEAYFEAVTNREVRSTRNGMRENGCTHERRLLQHPVG